MSVKGKVKRCNKRIGQLEKEINDLKSRLFNKQMDNSSKEQLYENIIKFAITNQIGNLKGGMMIDFFDIDKLKDLKLSIESNPREHAYIMRVNYY